MTGIGDGEAAGVVGAGPLGVVGLGKLKGVNAVGAAGCGRLVVEAKAVNGRAAAVGLGVGLKAAGVGVAGLGVVGDGVVGAAPLAGAASLVILISFSSPWMA